MELLERDNYLNDLTNQYQKVCNGRGHTVFLMGEAGIGKTSLINYFIREHQHTSTIYSGACDFLFTPRPLGPLVDIAVQMGDELAALLRNERDRSLIFSAFIHKLSKAEKPVILIFEDIHWADEATVDLIKFLARRISNYKCLFLLTYRDGEINSHHPLATIFGELPSPDFSKVLINRFSKQIVDELAARRGYASSGDQLYNLTGGNPFYVMEILASYSPGIPERIKDSILSVFHTRPDDTKALWEFFSILPSSRIELSIAKRIESDFAHCIDICISYGVIVSRPGHLSFKHELFRMAVEEQLSPSKRISLHKKMLKILQEESGHSTSLSQQVHHARFAEETALVAKLAPRAAREAALMGAHIEASKLYLTAIEYSDKQDPILAELYENHAYECYLTNQISNGIASAQCALELWKGQKVKLKEGDVLRFLSRLWWFEGDQKKAIALAVESISVLENGFPTRERALAYSNLSQLYMLADDLDQALYWGDKATELSVRMEDNEIASQALNNVGTALLKSPSHELQGEDKLNQSLTIALQHGLHEHAARAYTNLATTFVLTHQYQKARDIFDSGLKFCENKELNTFMYHMLSAKATMLLETGKWDEAEVIARSMQNSSSISRVGTISLLARLAMRRGNFEEAKAFIHEAKIMAMPTQELQRTIPVVTAALELSWISGIEVHSIEIKEAENSFVGKNAVWHFSDLIYWKIKCGLTQLEISAQELSGPIKTEIEGNWKNAAEQWQILGRPYEQALALFEGTEDHQMQALTILEELGASATIEMLKSKMRLMGVKKIPRGPRESTRNNPAQLTNRQIDVLHLLKEGLQNSEIADRLFLSVKTVNHHIASIFSKLDVNTRGKAVSEAKKMGIL